MATVVTLLLASLAGQAQIPFVGLINGDTIRLDEFSREVGRRRALSSTIGKTDDGALIEAAWNSIVRDVLIAQEARRRGISISKEAMQAELLANPPDYIRQGVTDDKGRFDAKLFAAMMSNPDSLVRARAGASAPLAAVREEATDLQASMHELIERARAVRMRDRVRTAVLRERGIDSALLLKQFRIQAAQCRADIVMVPCASSTEDPTDSELRTWYDRNSASYTTSNPMRRLATISWPMIARSEDTLALLSDVRRFVKECMALPAGRRRDSLFYVAAANTTASMMMIHADSAAVKALFPLMAKKKVGDVVGPAIVPAGVAVARLDSVAGTAYRAIVIVSPIEPGSAVVDSVLTLAKRALEAYDAGAELGSIAVANAKPIERSQWFTEDDRVYGSFRLADVAFRTPVGVACDLVDTPERGVVLAVVSDSVPRGVRPFESVRDEIRERVRRERLCQQRFRYMQGVRAVCSRTPEGMLFVAEQPSDAIIARDVTVRGNGMVGDDRYDPAFADVAVNLDDPGLYGPILGDLGWYVVNVHSVSHPSDEEFPLYLAVHGEALTMEQETSIFEDFERSLRQSARILDQRWITFRY
jgi:SurA N-terminal domain